MKEQISSLYEYGDWVNQRLLDTAAILTEEEFKRKVLHGFESVHQTLVHMLGAEVLWLARWEGQSPKSILAPADLMTVQAVRERWIDLNGERQAYLAGLKEAELDQNVEWTNMRDQSYVLPRWQVMLHCANHSTHHRSEVAAILTELGHEPDSTDLLEYYLGQSGQPWKPSVRS
ncbi:MAG TPA: DinB family protein [Anaerolineales bacterium]|nr:DinB family protein [Anaerolineales bacterium]